MFSKIFKPLMLSLILAVICVGTASLLTAAEYGPIQDGKYCTSASTNPTNTQCSKHKTNVACNNISFTRIGGSCVNGTSDQKCKEKLNIPGKDCERKCKWNGESCENDGTPTCTGMINSCKSVS